MPSVFNIFFTAAVLLFGSWPIILTGGGVVKIILHFYSTEYLIHPDAWKAEVCKGIDPKLAAKVLSDRGLLRVGDGGYQRKESVPGQGRIRVYVVTGDILDAD